MTDFVLMYEKERVVIFDAAGKVLLACYIRGEHSPEREKRIVELATRLYAECFDVDVLRCDGPFAEAPGSKPS